MQRCSLPSGSRIVKPPAMDPGSVVICETEKQLRPYMSEEDWEIQGDIPIAQEALELALSSRRTLCGVVAKIRSGKAC